MKEGAHVFDSGYRARSAVVPCSIASVASMVAKHYLKRRPAIVLLCVRMDFDGEPVGFVSFSDAPKETSKRYGTRTVELSRLYIEDSMPRNAETWLIGKALRMLSRSLPDVGAVVSYADPSANHKGTIYRASGFSFDGMTDSERKTPRSDYVDSVTGKKYGRKGNSPVDAVLVRVPRVSKHRYIKMLQVKRPLPASAKESPRG